MSDDDYGIKMRYSREGRLSRAGQEVKDLYERRSAKNKGFLSVLKKNRGLLYLFVTIIAFTLMYLAFPYLTGQDRGKKLGPYRLWAEAEYGNGTVTVSVDLTFASRLTRPETGEVLVVRASTDGALFSSREFVLSGTKDEKCYFRLPADAPPPAVECLVRLGGSEVSFRVPVKASSESTPSR